MTVLALLLHPVQYILRLFSGFLIHAGLFNFFLKLSHIGNIFRMQII